MTMVLYARINPDLERKLRIKIAEKYGGQKGALKKALEEAITLWLKESETNEKAK